MPSLSRQLLPPDLRLLLALATTEGDSSHVGSGGSCGVFSLKFPYASNSKGGFSSNWSRRLSPRTDERLGSLPLSEICPGLNPPIPPADLGDVPGPSPKLPCCDPGMEPRWDGVLNTRESASSPKSRATAISSSSKFPSSARSCSSKSG